MSLTIRTKEGLIKGELQLKDGLAHHGLMELVPQIAKLLHLCTYRRLPNIRTSLLYRATLKLVKRGFNNRVALLSGVNCITLNRFKTLNTVLLSDFSY